MSYEDKDALLYLADVRIDELQAENEQLRQRITTQKQTVQAYRDESREWQVEAEHRSAENAKLCELAAMLYTCMYGLLRDLAPSCFDQDEDGCGMDCTSNGEKCCLSLIERRMQALGVEVP